ncbi:MAG: RHS repeat-associated core domain-containing protein, partial [Planctomycetes bacterium]|nr:RHS repeat-associated core domain-containing protein [Planctomycetota bacterium]
PAPGRTLRRSHSNGTSLSYLDGAGTADIGYDGLRRPVELRHLGEGGEGSLLVGFTHAYDRTSNRLSEEKLHDPANGETYGYDSAYRLVSFERPAPGASAPLQGSWTLDGAGNWRQVDGKPRLHSSFNEVIERADDGPVAIASDQNGNVTDNGTFLLEWDYKNRLARVTRRADGAPIATYAYDALGRRARKLVMNSGSLDGTTRFSYDGWQVLEERDGADALRQQYVYGSSIDEVLVLDRDTDGDGTATGPLDGRFFYHGNSLHSVFALTDGAGTVVEGYQYEAYGYPTVYGPGPNGAVDWGADDLVLPGGASPAGNPYLFTGRRYDPETGLYFYRTRYYDPALGRFISRDTIGIWGDEANLGNGYAYAGNNPITRVDPEGTQTRFSGGPTKKKLTFKVKAEDCAGATFILSAQDARSLTPEQRQSLEGCKVIVISGGAITGRRCPGGPGGNPLAGGCVTPFYGYPRNSGVATPPALILLAWAIALLAGRRRRAGRGRAGQAGDTREERAP